MEMQEAIELLDRQISNPSIGLPEEIFFFISRLTPMVNVDLLIKDENGRILLAWRDDIYSGTGWHIPGGIVRFKETFDTRIQKVALSEIGVTVEYEPVPIAMSQMFGKHNNRGHFISILFNCFLSSDFIPKNLGLTNKDKGFLSWHNSCPSNLIKVQEIFKKYMTIESSEVFINEYYVNVTGNVKSPFDRSTISKEESLKSFSSDPRLK